MIKLKYSQFHGEHIFCWEFILIEDFWSNSAIFHETEMNLIFGGFLSLLYIDLKLSNQFQSEELATGNNLECTGEKILTDLCLLKCSLWVHYKPDVFDINIERENFHKLKWKLKI